MKRLQDIVDAHGKVEVGVVLIEHSTDQHPPYLDLAVVVINYNIPQPLRAVPPDLGLCTPRGGRHGQRYGC